MKEIMLAWKAFWQELTLTPAQKAERIYDVKTGTWKQR